MTTSRLTSHTRRARRGPSFLVLLAALAIALPATDSACAQRDPAAAALPASAPATRPHPLHPLGHYSYTWPLRPFHSQHPVRAFFGDPRIGPTHDGGLAHNFHFGIDIHGANGALIYASANGAIALGSRHGETVTLVADDGVTTFEYWHVAAHVRDGQRVIRNRTVIGHIARWNHVHFSERHNGRYVNPLREGALGPYRDRTRPYLKAFRVHAGLPTIRPDHTHGVVDLVVEAYDPAPTTLPEPWAGNPVTPATIRWRLVGRQGAVNTWRTSVDFRWGIPPNSAYSTVYARWTKQNKKAHEGRYRFVLAHGWDSRSVPDGSYEVEVATSDTRGNTGIARFPIAVLNQA